jgi:hypothetical protein
VSYLGSGIIDCGPCPVDAFFDDDGGGVGGAGIDGIDGSGD